MSSHILPVRTYVSLWAALMTLLLLTWGAAQLDLGPFNAVAALAIAVTKMLLIILIFMHVKYNTHRTWIFVAAGFIWFLIMVDLTMSDYLTRGSIPGAWQSWIHHENKIPAVQNREPQRNEKQEGPASTTAPGSTR
jgi:cytochrome c oxidase subunit IV